MIEYINEGQFFQPIYERPAPKARHNRREKEREYFKILDVLLGVELAFYDRLFNSFEDYGDLYSEYLEIYILALKQIDALYKPKYWLIDEGYFCKLNRPIERTY